MKGLSSSMGTGSEEERYVIGIDGGGSKTACVVMRYDRQIVGRGAGGPINTNFVDPETAKQSIESAVREALSKAGCKESQIDAVCIGGPSDRHLVEEHLSHILPGVRVMVAGEFEVCRAIAGSPEVCVVVVAGTGSAAIGRNANGETASAGGWGALFGDEGSGYDIGRKALIACAKAEDGRGEPTILTDLITSHLSLARFPDIINWAYRNGNRNRRDIAGLAPLVTQAAALGDRVARKILDDAAGELIDAVRSVVRRLCITDVPFDVIACGGMFRSGEMFTGPFRERLKSEFTSASLIVPEMGPEVGAALLALEHVGC